MFVEQDIDFDGGCICLLTMFWFFGYVFNLFSVWYCEYWDGSLCVVLLEVWNMFGEYYYYLLHEGGGLMQWLVCAEK